MTVYLAGPITGNPGYMADFARWEAFLTDLGHVVFNPALLGEVAGWSWADYLKRDIPHLVNREAVFAMPGWESSRGAVLEVDLARRLGLRCWTARNGKLAVMKP